MASMAHPGGRPLKWTTPADLKRDADAYFSSIPKEKWTITGLALALKTNRETLCNYEDKDEFFDTVKECKQKVEDSYEEILKERGHSGAIFGLKNFGWRDEKYLDHTTGGEKLSAIGALLMTQEEDGDSTEQTENI